MAKKTSRAKKYPAADAGSPFALVHGVRALGLRARFDEAKRRAVTAPARRRRLAAAMEKAGLSVDRLEEQQRREWALMSRQAARQQKSALVLLKQQRIRQRRALRTIVEHRDRFEYRRGNPHTSICLWRAIAAPDVLVNVQTFSDGVAQLTRQPETSVRTGDNTIRFTAEARGRPAHGFQLSPVAAVDLVTEAFFDGAIPHDGTLSVTATFAPLGTIFLGAPGDFILHSSAGADIRIYMRIIVNPGSGSGFELPFGDTTTIAENNLISTFDGVSALMVIGGTHAVAHQLSRPNAVEVHEGDVVRVIAGYDVLIAGGARGIAQLNFFPAPLGFNVPMVLLRVDR